MSGEHQPLICNTTNHNINHETQYSSHPVVLRRNTGLYHNISCLVVGTIIMTIITCITLLVASLSSTTNNTTTTDLFRDGGGGGGNVMTPPMTEHEHALLNHYYGPGMGWMLLLLQQQMTSESVSTSSSSSSSIMNRNTHDTILQQLRQAQQTADATIHALNTDDNDDDDDDGEDYIIDNSSSSSSSSINSSTHDSNHNNNNGDTKTTSNVNTNNRSTDNAFNDDEDDDNIHQEGRNTASADTHPPTVRARRILHEHTNRHHQDDTPKDDSSNDNDSNEKKKNRRAHGHRHDKDAHDHTSSTPIGCETTIVLIRHCEKELIAEHCAYNGYERSVYISTLFGNTRMARYPKPYMIYAESPISRNEGHKMNFREVETVGPLAETLDIPIDDSYTDATVRNLAHHLRENVKNGNFCGKVVVVVWKHTRIAELAHMLGCGPIQGCPLDYSGKSFDQLWQIRYVYTNEFTHSTHKHHFLHHPSDMVEWKVFGSVQYENFDPLAFSKLRGDYAPSIQANVAEDPHQKTTTAANAAESEPWQNDVVSYPERSYATDTAGWQMTMIGVSKEAVVATTVVENP